MAKKNSNTKTLNENASSLLEKRKMAEMIIGQIKTSFGPGSIMKMDEITSMDIEAISTGSLAVDLATGIGGLPKGRIIEIYGPEASGKTSLALSTIAQSQKEGGITAFIDAEHAFDPTWASRFGVNISDLYVSQPGNGEEALEIVDNLVRSNAFDVIVIDSVAALVPRSEIEGNMGDASMGVQARLMSQALRKLTGVISKSKTVVIFINQIRLKIGVMFGNPETTTGGQALKFYASQRFEVRKSGVLKSGSDQIGIRVKIKIVKNKMAPPFEVVEIDLIPSQPGVFNLPGEIIDYGSEYGVIQKTGNTYKCLIDENGKELSEDQIQSLGVGRQKAIDSLLKNHKLVETLKKQIFDKFKTEKTKKNQELLNNQNSDSEDALPEDITDKSTDSENQNQDEEKDKD